MSHTKINHEIQALRGIAVILVVVQHLGGLFVWAPLPWAQIGRGFWVGVDLFFCISGFVIARDFLPRVLDKYGSDYWREIGAFWIRRFYRISPSAWVWLAIPMLLTPFFQHLPELTFSNSNISDMASAILHVANFRHFKCTAEASGCGWFAHYWSLSLEEQFYLLLPFIVFFARRHLVALLSVLILSQFFLTRTYWNGILAFIRTDAILFGVLLAIFSATNTYRILEPKINKSFMQYLIPPTLLICLIVTTRQEIVTFYNGLAALICALILWLCSFDKGYFVLSVKIKMLLSKVGERSYAIYLIHMPAFWLTIEIWSRIMPEGFKFNSSFNLRFFATAMMLIGILAELNLRMVERPLRKIGKNQADRLLLRQF